MSRGYYDLSMARTPRVTLPGVTHHRHRLNGVRLHWVEQGDGVPVVFLHGFPEFWWSWRHQIPALGEHFRVVAVDMRGFNESDKPTYGYDLTTLAGDIAALIDHLGGKAHVVGHDWGGAVAYQLAMDTPRKVDRLAILNAPHPDAWIESWLTHPEQQQKSWYVFLNQLPDLPEALYREQFANGSIRLARVMHPDAVAVYRRAFEKPGVATAAVNYYREIVRDIGRRRRLKPKRIRRPVRVLWGEKDVALHPVVNDIASRWCDDFEVTYVPDAWHWLASERPKLVNRFLLDFLR